MYAPTFVIMIYQCSLAPSKYTLPKFKTVSKKKLNNSSETNFLGNFNNFMQWKYCILIFERNSNVYKDN